MWILIQPLCKHVCFCAHCNEYLTSGRDCISPLLIWLKMSLNVYFGFCESLVPPLKGALLAYAVNPFTARISLENDQ